MSTIAELKAELAEVEARATEAWNGWRELDGQAGEAGREYRRAESHVDTIWVALKKAKREEQPSV